MNIAIYLKNRSPTRNLKFKTHFEALYGFNIAVKLLAVFGSKAFSHIPKEDKIKLDSKAIRCTFVGYFSQFKAYRLFNPSTHNIFVSRDVMFHEQVHDKSNKCNEEWDISFLVEGSEETDNSHD